MVATLVQLLIVGLVAGFVARLLVPGPDPMSVGGTLLLGIAGSFVGGFLGYLFFRHQYWQGFIQTAGLIGSVIGAVVVLLVLRAVRGRSRAT